MKKIILLTLTFLGCFGTAQATVVDISAFDTGSMTSTNTWNDDRLRAYYSGSHLDGFMKFDLSGLDDSITINSITLTTYHEQGYSNPLNDPQVRLYHVTNDSWSRGSSHPGLDEAVSGIYSGFPSTSYTAFEWDLDVSAFDWSADLFDDTLSLAMRNEKTSYSYVYWHGSDNQQYAPTLTIDYDINAIPEPAIALLLGFGLVAVGVTRRK